MVFTPDGKATREPLGKPGDKIDGNLEGREGRLLHAVERTAATNCYRLVTNRLIAKANGR